MRERPEGSGRWELRVSIGRDPLNASKYRQVSRVFRGSKREAKRALAELEIEMENQGAHGNASMTFKALLQSWVNASSPHWSSTTTPSNVGQLNRYVYPALGSVQIRKLRTEDFDQLYGALLAMKTKKCPNGLSPATVLRVHQMCHAALEMAVRYRWLRYNVSTQARRPQADAPLKERRDLPPTESILAMFEAATEHDPEWGRLLVSALGLGVRRSELLGIQIGSVDTADPYISVLWRILQPNNGKHIEIVPARHRGGKGKRRTFEADPFVMDLLREQIKFIQNRAADFGLETSQASFLWSDDIDGANPWKPTRVTRRFTRLRNSAKLDIRLHDLRHLNGTYLADMGIDLSTIAHRMGHSRDSTTANFYLNRTPAGDTRAAKVLEGLWKVSDNVVANDH